MVRKRAVPAPAERKNRVMLSFGDRDHETLAQEARAAKLPIATYARILILEKLDQIRSQASSSR